MKKIAFGLLVLSFGISKIFACECTPHITAQPPIISGPVVTSVTAQTAAIATLSAIATKNVSQIQENTKVINATTAVEEKEVITNSNLAFELNKKVALLSTAIQIAGIE